MTNELKTPLVSGTTDFNESAHINALKALQAGDQHAINAFAIAQHIKEQIPHLNLTTHLYISPDHGPFYQTHIHDHKKEITHQYHSENGTLNLYAGHTIWADDSTHPQSLDSLINKLREFFSPEYISSHPIDAIKAHILQHRPDIEPYNEAVSQTTTNFWLRDKNSLTVWHIIADYDTTFTIVPWLSCHKNCSQVHPQAAFTTDLNDPASIDKINTFFGITT